MIARDSSDSEQNPSDSVGEVSKIKPRPFVSETGRDFFERKPRATIEDWNDQLTAWQVRFADTTVSWSAKEQHRHARQSLRDIEKFRGDNRFPQDVLNEWELKLDAVLQQAEKVNKNACNSWLPVNLTFAATISQDLAEAAVERAQERLVQAELDKAKKKTKKLHRATELRYENSVKENIVHDSSEVLFRML
jgi:hypothetical protein